MDVHGDCLRSSFYHDYYNEDFGKCNQKTLDRQTEKVTEKVAKSKCSVVPLFHRSEYSVDLGGRVHRFRKTRMMGIGKK